jgi:hypothetical protein
MTINTIEPRDESLIQAISIDGLRSLPGASYYVFKSADYVLSQVSDKPFEVF